MVHTFDPTRQHPPSFKGIALFTPGGDLVYSIDPEKRERWHLQLCAALQDVLGLEEPPHFLVPCYTATIDCWIDPVTHQQQLLAEGYPAILQHQVLLNTIFNLTDVTWQQAPTPHDLCDPILFTAYYQQFPELWCDHNLIMDVASLHAFSGLPDPVEVDQNSIAFPPQGYVFRLFVSGHSHATERALQNLHQLLTQSLAQPYTLKVIDVRKHPELAEADHVSAIPTLLRVWPKPMRRIVGELHEPTVILQALGL